MQNFPRRLLPAAASFTVAGALAGCGVVSVPPGVDAANPACAEIVRSAPDFLLGSARTDTDSQGTVAWGRGANAIVLRCGVADPGPTTELCTSLTTPDGIEVDWIVRINEESEIAQFTTYGRTPAIDVTVPFAAAGDQPSAAVLDLAGVVSLIPATDHCVGAGDA